MTGGRATPPMLPDSSLAAFVRALPKTETHLHVEGALPYELLHAWDPARWPDAPAFRERGYRYATFPDFERQLLDHALPWFTSAERYYEAAKLIFARLHAQNVAYVETSFHLPVVDFIKVPGPEIVAAIRSAAPKHFHVRVFTGMPRDIFSSPHRHLLDGLAGWEGLAGVDLHGYEPIPTAPGTAEWWARFRAAGLVTKCHAGEFDGAARVREAVEVLGVTRVQHGVRAIEDPAVVRLCAERGVTFDVCPLSNVGLAGGPPAPPAPRRRHPLHAQHRRPALLREFPRGGVPRRLPRARLQPPRTRPARAERLRGRPAARGEEAAVPRPARRPHRIVRREVRRPR